MATGLSFYGTIESGKTFDLPIRNTGWEPAYIDVYDPAGAKVVDNDTPYEVLTLLNLKIVKFAIDTTGFPIGDTYCVVIKDGTATDPTNFLLGYFNVIFNPAVTDAKVDQALVSLASLHTKVDGLISRVIRVLALEAENVVIDNMVEDGSGNISSARVRLFDSGSNAANATLGAVGQEVGEIARYTVGQTFNVPRRIRSSYRSYLTWKEADV